MFTPRVALYYACLAAIGLMVGVVGPTLGALATQTGQDLRSISAILAMRPLGYLGGVLLAGRLFDRRRGHPVLLAAVLLVVASLAGVPLAGSLAALTVVVLAIGLADGVLDVGGNTLLVWEAGSRSGPLLNGLHFAFGVGAFLAPLIVAGTLALNWSASSAYWVIAALVLPLIPWLAILPSPPHQAAAKREAKAPAMDRVVAGGVLALFLLYGGCEAAFGSWLASYVTALGVGDAQHAAYLTSAFWAALSLGRLAAIPLAQRVAAPALLAADLALAALGLGCLLAFPGSAAARWLGACGAGLGLASFFPILLAYGGKRLAPGGRISGRLTSLFFVGSSTGNIALPWLSGQLFGRSGPRAGMGLIFGGVVLMGLVLWVLTIPRSAKKRPAAPSTRRKTAPKLLPARKRLPISG